MSGSNLKLALRSILRRKFISLVIVLSITLGLVCSFYIVGFVYNEVNVDRFNKNYKRIYGLISDHPQVQDKKVSMILDGVPQYIKKTYPEVADYCQVGNQSIDKIKIGEINYFSTFRIIEVSPSFFSFFSFPLISGNANQVLSTNQMVVVSKEFAGKYFGNTDVIGKSIEMNQYGTNRIFTISGIFDNTLVHSHLTFDIVMSNIDREIMGSYAYLLLDKSADPAELGRKLIKDKENIPAFFSDIPIGYYLQELKNIYFHPLWESKIVKSRNVQYIYIAILIGIMVLLVACFNYANLTYSQLTDRIKETVIKKILGAGVARLSKQLLTECVLLISAATAIALVYLKKSIFFFNRLTESGYQLSEFLHPSIIVLYIVIVVLIVLLSGLFVSRFIQKQKSTESVNISGLPKVKKKILSPLIIFQFATSIILVVSTLTIVKQVNYIHNMDIGLDKSVIEISLKPEYAQKANLFVSKLHKYPAIANVSACEGSPMHGGSKVLINYTENGIKKMYMPSIYAGDVEYLNISGITLLEGEQFSDIANNNSNKCIINKALAELLNMESPVGKLMPGTENEIIGVCDNFLWRSIENPAEDAYIVYEEKGTDILIKLQPSMQTEGVNYIKKCWSDLFSEYPLDMVTIGELFNREHKKQEHLVKLITTFCLLSIFIAVIGLIALSLYAIQQRTKEIGIRKAACGAKAIEIVMLLNMKIIKWVLVALVIATPIAWYFMNKWLENFAYKTTLSWWIFALAGLLVLTIALLTVSWQSWRAATRNPVEALRYE